MTVADPIACILPVYGRSMAFVKPWVRGWWGGREDLTIEPCWVHRRLGSLSVAGSSESSLLQ
jgi:hypothetical protein